MSHSEMDQLYELYLLGLLDESESAEIERHLSEGCEHCRQGIDRAATVVAALAELAPRRQPPPALRERTLRTVATASPSLTPATLKRPPTRTLPLFLAAALAASVLIAAGLSLRVRQLSTDLETAQGQREQLRAALQTLSRGETRTAQFGRPDQPHGRVFVGRQNGVVLVASSLPALAPGKTFELWLVPKAGAPTPAGLFQANPQGDSVQISTVTISPDTAAVAVSVEPTGGSPAPSTTPVIVVPLGG